MQKAIAQEALLKNNLYVKKVFKQPPNKSPEFNALDCAIFNSIEKKVYRACPRSIGELINCVKRSFNSIHRDTIDDFFVSSGFYEGLLSSSVAAM